MRLLAAHGRKASKCWRDMPSKIIIPRQRDGVKGFTLYSIRLSGSIDFWAMARDCSAADAGGREHKKAPGGSVKSGPQGRSCPGPGSPRPRSPKGAGRGGPAGGALRKDRPEQRKGDHREPAVTRGLGCTGRRRQRVAAEGDCRSPQAAPERKSRGAARGA